jgi:GalNAc-alpha-(1->4)-GalNAc-alpha-(1->3)-diNAcBac-PP-undecaprenol alpha-1,4-N-acetyl-D-galactosaminyltransferase
MLAVHSLEAGGAERVVSEMASWWAARGRAVAVLTLDPVGKDCYPLHPHVQRVSFNLDIPRTRLHIPLHLVRRLIDIRHAVLGCKPDVLVSFIDRMNITMLCALAGTGIPLIVTERTDPRHHDIGFFWSLFRRLIYPLSRMLVVQTDSVSAWARRIVPDSRVGVIPNFVRPLPAPEETTSGEMPAGPFVLAVGRLSREKGHDVLISSFARTGAHQQGWRLVILGDGPERPSLERLAAGLGIAGAVSMPGIVREPAAWMYKAGIFVLPSRYEGFPNALLEAMSCGCAVISTNCPSGPAEIIHHDQDGLLVPAEDIEALSSAMKRCMRDETLRERLGRRALDVRSRFSQSSIMAQWDGLMANVCAPAP